MTNPSPTTLSADAALPPADAARLLARPVVAELMRDRRSRAWLVEGEDGRRWVVKRFERGGFCRRVAEWFGGDPVKRDVFWRERLAAAALPVVSIAGQGVDGQGRHWLVMPWVGSTLAQWAADGRLAGEVRVRHDVTRQLGGLAGALLQMRVLDQGFVATSFVIDDQGQLWLADASGCRGSKGTPLLAVALRMLASLNTTVKAASGEGLRGEVVPTRADRLRFYRAMLTAWPTLPDGVQHLPRSRELG